MHWAIPLVTPLFALWNPAWLVGAMVAYAVVANAPCLIVQRYNRGRLLRVLTRRNERRTAPACGGGVIRLLVAASALVAMEPAVAAVHRWVMHGRGWAWHRSHHRWQGHRIEANDLYPVVFAAATIATMAVGAAIEGLAALVWVGAGVTGYGIAYLVVHDLFIHERLGRLPGARSRYVRWWRGMPYTSPAASLMASCYPGSSVPPPPLQPLSRPRCVRRLPPPRGARCRTRRTWPQRRLRLEAP